MLEYRFMEAHIPGIVLAFREGLEAFLISAVLFRFLERTDRPHLKKYVRIGLGTGVAFSLVFGVAIFWLSGQLLGVDAFSKLWESAASLFAVMLVIPFVVWMIREGSNMKAHIESKAHAEITGLSLVVLTTLLVAREGVEIVLFSYAGEFSVFSLAVGLAMSIVLSLCIFYSLVRVKISTIFTWTLIYLVLQAGYLLGYGAHEGLSAIKEIGWLPASDPLYIKVFDFSGTILDHKDGWIGLPLHILFGWYSKPEWLQFVLQYGTVGILYSYWYHLKLKAETDGKKSTPKNSKK